MRLLLHTLLLPPLCASLFACSVFRPVGQENFNCNGKNSTNPYCRSIKGIDRSTQGNIPDTKFDTAFNYEDYDKYSGDYVDTQGKPTKEATHYAKSGVLPHEIGGSNNAPIVGAPVRMAPVVQKIWVNRYVDGQDKLHQPVEVYQEVIGSRWSGVASGQNYQAEDGRAYPHMPPKAPQNPREADSGLPRDPVEGQEAEKPTVTPIQSGDSQKEDLGNPQ